MESEAEYLMQAKLNHETRWAGASELISENGKSEVIGGIGPDRLERFLTILRNAWSSQTQPPPILPGLAQAQ